MHLQLYRYLYPASDTQHPNSSPYELLTIFVLIQGIKKICMTAVIPMNVSMDEIIEEILEDIFPDEIQSMEMTNMSLL